jgi:hypothetical protein
MRARIVEPERKLRDIWTLPSFPIVGARNLVNKTLRLTINLASRSALLNNPCGESLNVMHIQGDYGNFNTKKRCFQIQLQAVRIARGYV